MIGVIDFLLMVVAAFALIPASMFFLEIIASFFSRVETAVAADVERGSLAIIVPAHNEGAHLLPTLRALKAALGPVDRLLVVADNCDDDTAANARKTGAEVIERQDSSRRGKGFALQFGIDYLREKPPTLVGFFDADVGFDDAAVAALAGAAVQTGRPCQALYLMQAPENASPKLAIAEFAWLLINKVRMLGLSRLADVTRFTGAGLVAPWEVVENTAFATDNIVEDLFLSFTFARNGHAPKFCPNVSVTSCFPTSDDAGAKQRARWEHGSLATAHRTALPAFIDGVVSANWRLCALALDAIIPPIIILIAVTMMLVGMAAALALLGANASVGPALMAFFSVVFGVAVSWAAYGRKALPPSKLKGAGAFLLEKLNVYGASGRRASQTWTRTDRDPSDDAS